jgi:two-component system aerobic respiration control sensor histidine kinase ArcB
LLITETFSLSTLLHDIVDLFQPSIKAKELDFEIRINPDAPDHLKGCRAGFYRIMLNLIGNAIKFTHAGKIFVNVNFDIINLRHINLYISIEDTGIGIANDKFDIIFDRFTRLIPSYKGTYEGSGIGLYIVKRYTTAMNGSIQVASQENKGSRFDITLPFTIDQQPIKPIPDKCVSHALPMKKLTETIRVLLVEDNFAAQMMQKTLLTSMQCRVDLVDNGEKALELFEPGKFDLIFLDIGLPGIQGDTVARLIRKLEQHSEHRSPIIALTAHTTSDVVHQYLTNGIDAVYSKPLTKENAEEILALHISNHEHA